MPAPNQPNISANLCPVCGQANSCAMACADPSKTHEPCWCTEVVFTRQVLERIPEAARGWACVCKACAQWGVVKPQ